MKFYSYYNNEQSLLIAKNNLISAYQFIIPYKAVMVQQCG